ncbi:hypothetical protein BDZ91DRAFT_833048, partial [Kalaharituber pfeilii]
KVRKRLLAQRAWRARGHGGGHTAQGARASSDTHGWHLTRAARGSSDGRGRGEGKREEAAHEYTVLYMVLIWSRNIQSPWPSSRAASKRSTAHVQHPGCPGPSSQRTRATYLRRAVAVAAPAPRRARSSKTPHPSPPPRCQTPEEIKDQASHRRTTQGSFPILSPCLNTVLLLPTADCHHHKVTLYTPICRRAGFPRFVHSSGHIQKGSKNKAFPLPRKKGTPKSESLGAYLHTYL